MSDTKLVRSLKSTAEHLDMPYSAIHTAAKRGALRTRRVGHRYYVEHDDAIDWFRSFPTGDSPVDE